MPSFFFHRMNDMIRCNDLIIQRDDKKRSMFIRSILRPGVFRECYKVALPLFKTRNPLFQPGF